MLPRSNIVVRNDLPGLRVSLDETRTPERGSAVREQETDTRERSYPQSRHRPVVEAAQALLSAWPEEYEDWRCMMRVVVPRMPPPGWQMEGFTISSMQGAAWIHPSSTLRTLESLVHEHSHVKLRYVEEAVPLLQAGQTHARFRVGWRTDPRPVVGIFEGVYVHLHCVMALVRYLEGNGLDAPARCEAAARLNELRAQAREGLELLKGHAHFTEAGQGFLYWAASALARHLNGRSPGLVGLRNGSERTAGSAHALKAVLALGRLGDQPGVLAATRFWHWVRRSPRRPRAVKGGP